MVALRRRGALRKGGKKGRYAPPLEFDRRRLGRGGKLRKGKKTYN